MMHDVQQMFVSKTAQLRKINLIPVAHFEVGLSLFTSSSVCSSRDVIES